MRPSEIKELAPEIVRRITVSEDRVKDLRKRVRATALAMKWASEFYQRLMQDALIDEEDAWDECAQLAGFKDLPDMQEQGYEMGLVGNQLQLRRRKDYSPDETNNR